MNVSVTPETVKAEGNPDSTPQFMLRIAKGMNGPWVQRIRERFPEARISTETTQGGATILTTNDRSAWTAAVDTLGKYPRDRQEPSR